MSVFFFVVVFASAAVAQDHSENQEPDYTSIDGSVLYRRLCVECHGMKGSPPRIAEDLFEPPPPILRAREDLAKTEHETLVAIIAEGWGKNMLPYRNFLTDAQIAALARFLREMAQEGP